MPIKQEQIDEISARCSSATDGDTWPTNHPGRWYSEYDSDSGVFKVHADNGDKRVTICYAKEENDAEFIAHTRSDIPALLAEVIWLRAELDKVKPKHKGDPAAFEAFYKAYPNKKAKAAAQKAWDKLNPDPALIKTIMTALEAQKRSEAWLNDGGKFIPYPERWLKNKRWADEIKFVQIKKGTQKFDYDQRPYAPGELDALFETFGGEDEP